MALRLCVGLLLRLRAGNEEWPSEMPTPQNATAYWKTAFPEMFYSLPRALETACNTFGAEEQRTAVLQWAYDAKSGIASTSGVVKGVRVGHSQAGMLAHYEAALAVRVEAAKANPRVKQGKKAAVAAAVPAAAAPATLVAENKKRRNPAATRSLSTKRAKTRHTDASDEEFSE
jgi:hypothetical protein